MDVPRKSAARKRRIRRIILMVVIIGVAGGITYAVSRLEKADPGVEITTLLMDTVKRGTIPRQVRGLGVLVPEEIRWIPAATDGRVERILIKPGTTVTADTVIMELSNPTVVRDSLDADSQLKASEAELKRLEIHLQSEYLRQKAESAKVQSDYSQAKLQADTHEGLAKDGLIANLTAKLSRVNEQELANRNSIEKERLDIMTDSIKAQIAVQREQVDQRRALYQLRRGQLDALHVRAGISGVLQQVPVQEGEQVGPAAKLARVARPDKLKAELKIAETQTKDLELGQRTSVDTRTGIVIGYVSRIDPASENGTVKVDIRLEGDLPRGARPDQSVEGTIELERLEDILYVGRPVHGQENSTIGLFKYDPQTGRASRVQVRLGRSSVSTIEILEGLQLGDQVVLSDMSQWDGYERVRVN